MQTINLWPFLWRQCPKQLQSTLLCSGERSLRDERNSAYNEAR